MSERTDRDARLNQIRARWAYTNGQPWRCDDQGILPDGSYSEALCGVVCVWPEPHGVADVLSFGDMEECDGDDLRNSQAVAHAPEDVAFLLAEVAALGERLRAQEAQQARLRVLLEGLEWLRGYCPNCERHEDDGHSDACVLGAALAGTEAPRPPQLPALTFEEATAMVTGVEQQLRDWEEERRREALGVVLPPPQPPHPEKP